jgi:hypothetical protein
MVQCQAIVPGIRCTSTAASLLDDLISSEAVRMLNGTMPKKERLPSPGEAGTKLLNSNSQSASKYSISVLALPLLGFPSAARNASTMP